MNVTNFNPLKTVSSQRSVTGRQCGTEKIVFLATFKNQLAAEDLRRVARAQNDSTDMSESVVYCYANFRY